VAAKDLKAVEHPQGWGMHYAEYLFSTFGKEESLAIAIYL
jgi:hypothetical protein